MKVSGLRIGEAVAIESGAMDVEGPSGRQALQSVYTNPFGAQRTVVLLVNFASNPVQPYTTATARNTVFTTTSNWDLENSYQQTWLTGDVFGWYTIALSPTRSATTARWPAQARPAATAAGVNLVELLSTTSTPSRACGVQLVGPRVRGRQLRRSAWINGSLSAHGRRARDGARLRPLPLALAATAAPSSSVRRARSTEYGDVLDIDGGQSRTTSTRFRRSGSAGWRYGSSPPIKTVTSSGTYTIDPYESLGSSSEGAEDSQGHDRLLFLRRGEARPRDSTPASRAARTSRTVS